jgi:hypothetical protein
MTCEKQCCSKTFHYSTTKKTYVCGNHNGNDMEDKPKCISTGQVCHLNTNCTNCCEDNSAHYYNTTSELYQCGTAPCWNDHVICHPEKDCYQCCHGAYLVRHNNTTTKTTTTTKQNKQKSSIQEEAIYQCGADCSADKKQCSYNYFLPP